MFELTFQYWNQMASQILTISSLLGGFSIAIIANLLVSDTNTKMTKRILIASTSAACFFLITVFGMTSIILKTTEGYPIEVAQGDFDFERVFGSLSFFLGVVSLIAIISMAGWTKSRKLGIFTTAAGILTLIFIIAMLS